MARDSSVSSSYSLRLSVFSDIYLIKIHEESLSNDDSSR